MAGTKKLKKIKKLYGENFMKLCRNLFPSILEEEGLLLKVLTLLAKNTDFIRYSFYELRVKYNLS